MIYLPDTNVCIAHMRKPDSPVSERLRLCRPNDIALCDIVKKEKLSAEMFAAPSKGS